MSTKQTLQRILKKVFFKRLFATSLSDLGGCQGGYGVLPELTAGTHPPESCMSCLSERAASEVDVKLFYGSRS